METYITFDLGGTYTKFALIDAQAELLETGRQKTPKTLDSLIAFMKEYADKHPEASGIAISSPGAVSEEGIVYGSSAINYLHGPNIKELVEKETKKAVHIENDANCAGWAELWKGAAKGKKDVLVVVIGTGIGGSVIQNGEVYKGKNLHAGEFGYMLISNQIRNSNDVWSRVASTQAMVRKVAEAKQLTEEELTGEQIFQWAEQGDPVSLQAIDEFYYLLAAGLYNLQYSHDPELILIGAGSVPVQS
ncbi:ROK family protein [Halobacillus salinarum]|uniref:ROK family protein n=1 Tax=Halobacillus salinarum TaxID=2932257 RepID=A0ABY4EMF7_9BACI|nr:ROK family protein [Halobacillus salinarum]UOQ45638.1 ROK family protein [Halobacillus salinarum]